MMKIEVYAVPYYKVNSDRMLGYTFNVIMSHSDGKKSFVGDFSVSRNNEVLGGVGPLFEINYETIEQAKKVILAYGLAEVVGGAADPRNFFWKTFVTLPPGTNLAGIFDRAKALIQGGKAIEVSQEDYDLMMEKSEMLDKEETYESQIYDGVTGSDEYDEEFASYEGYEPLDEYKKGR